MGLALKFIRLPLDAKYLYLEAMFWLGISRVAILILPFKTIAPHLGRHMAEIAEDKNKDRDPENSQAIKQAVSKAVETTARYLPWKCRCLVQAMAGKKMLDKRQIPATLYLGVSKAEEKGLAAHAWLRSGEFILTGDIGLNRFVVVSTFS